MPPKLILPPFVGCICGNPDCNIPYGECHCGCGGKTALPRDNDIKNRRFFGVPVQFISGHRNRIRPVIENAMPFKIDGVYCRLIPLSRGLYTIVDDSMYVKLCAFKYQAMKTRYPGKYYAVRAITISGKTHSVFMHRVVLNMPENDKRFVDHINGNGLDNRSKNLRIASPSQNGGNSVISKNNKSGYKGVFWHKRQGAWMASIMKNRKTIRLGLFDTPKEAHDAYCAAALRLFGEFANFG
jgi:hypothetical protein